MAEGQGIENLSPTVDKIARDLRLTIFKRQKILAVEVSGNQRIETDAIKRVIKTQPGDIYNLKNLSADLKAIYAMGYFDDIQIETESRRDGIIVTFKIKEKPTRNFELRDYGDMLRGTDAEPGYLYINPEKPWPPQ